MREGLYTFWNFVQSDLSKDEYDFSEYDAQWQRVPEGMLLVTNIAPSPIGPAPSGAPSGPAQSGSQVRPSRPSYYVGDTWQPVDERKYAAFVKAAVERYDGDGVDDMPGLKSPIRYWQVGNEIDLEAMMNGRGIEGFAGVQRITYEAAKEADPGTRVLLAGSSASPQYTNNFDKYYLPVLQELGGSYIDVVDLHFYGDASGDYLLRDADGIDIIGHVRKRLDETGYGDVPIWVTEMGTWSGDPPDAVFGAQSERQHALDLLKRYVYLLSRGVKRAMWLSVVEGYQDNNNFFAYMGLIYDGQGSGEPSRGTKKLAYYTYKRMTETLEGSDWGGIETVIAGEDNIYAFKFTKGGKPVWVVWWDYWNEPGAKTKTATVPIAGISKAEVAEAVPNRQNGKDVASYSTAFKSGVVNVASGTLTLQLGDSPVFIEEASGAASGFSPTPVSQQDGGPGTGTGPQTGLCGDGTCDEIERNMRVCPQDCGTQTGNPGPQTGLCGDGTCDQVERNMGVCPQDCA